MNAPETKYYEDGNVVVTNSRAILKGKTFAMSNITSVAMGEVNPNRTKWIVMALAGLILAGYGISDAGSYFLCIGIGVLLLLAGAFMTFTLKKQYVVRIGSASGESDGLVSPDRVYITKIVTAINQAIVNRG